MGLAKTRHDKLLAILDERIREGEGIRAAAKHIPARVDQEFPGGFQTHIRARDLMDFDRFAEWRSKSMSVAVQIVPPGNAHRQEVERFATAPADIGHLRYILAKLRALKDDFGNGLLDDVWLLVRAEVAGDYMAQAEILFAEGYHVPAAVLAGAVLEDAMRRLSDGKGLATMKPSGQRRGINAMNDDLAKASVYNAAKAHEIRAWADNRNDCAHGDGGKVKPDDVDRMIKGVRTFVADYLK